MSRTSNIYRLPMDRVSGRGQGKRRRMHFATAILILSAMLLVMVIIRLQQAQSVQQDIAIRNLSARMTVTELRTRDMWKKLGFSEVPASSGDDSGQDMVLL